MKNPNSPSQVLIRFLLQRYPMIVAGSCNGALWLWPNRFRGIRTTKILSSIRALNGVRQVMEFICRHQLDLKQTQIKLEWIILLKLKVKDNYFYFEGIKRWLYMKKTSLFSYSHFKRIEIDKFLHDVIHLLPHFLPFLLQRLGQTLLKLTDCVFVYV